MAAAAENLERLVSGAIVDSGSLTLFLCEAAESVKAEFYMLLTTATRNRQIFGRVIAANWVFDAVELVGAVALGDLTMGDLATLPGARPRAILTSGAPGTDPRLPHQTHMLLDRLGHAEIYCLRLNIGRHHYFLLLSAGSPGVIDVTSLGTAQMRCNYALSSMSDELRAAILKDTLTTAERECLAWAAEGKTSEEIALILGVNANSVNASIAGAIDKLHARNRVEAVATAIRMGTL